MPKDNTNKRELEREVQTLQTFSYPHNWPITVESRCDRQIVCLGSLKRQQTNSQTITQVENKLSSVNSAKPLYLDVKPKVSAPAPLHLSHYFSSIILF